MTDLPTLVNRVAAIPEPSRALARYAGAPLQAMEMEALPKHVDDRDLRITNTRIVAKRRLRLLSAEDRARVEAAGGVIE